MSRTLWPRAFYVATVRKGPAQRRLLLGPFDERAVAETAMPAATDLLASGASTPHLEVVALPARGRLRLPPGELNAEAIAVHIAPTGVS
ncbi:hypothetical protein [Isoptericola croceus]|uniref:hypothetical protein n=1 Tax=Isoptericola croceus TaxID=3031406 RepID=UPI0023F69127|nr:hypothetical protein [Isoptericola croceus]